jgi:UDP-2,3-diacylglucosamine hydrolase
MADWLFMGDAHLREWDFQTQERIIRFLESEKKNLETLVILGDLFEFWFGFESFAFEGYQPVLDELNKLVKRGVHIRYLEGNHEFAMGPYFEETLRAQIDANDSVIDLDGKRIYMAHGDLVNKKDTAYRIFRGVLKNPITYWLARRFGPRASKKVAAFLSSLSAGEGNQTNPERTDHILRQFALDMAKKGFDVVILAHHHLPQSCSLEIDGRESHYFNVGGWADHFSFLRYRRGQGFGIEYFQE